MNLMPVPTEFAYPPCQAALNLADLKMNSTVPWVDVLRDLKPAATPAINEMLLVNDHRSIEANLLRIDFVKSDFERRRTTEERGTSEGDPPPDLGFEIANRFLQSVRTITRGSLISVLYPSQTFWELAYLNDDQTLAPKDPNLFQRICGLAQQWKAVSLSKTVWDGLDRPMDQQPVHGSRSCAGHGTILLTMVESRLRKTAPS